MDYPQIPLVNTYMSDNLGLSQLPSGMNVVLAISTFTGYNQEDSIIFNKASIEKGLFRVVTRRTILIEEKKVHKNRNEMIMFPQSYMKLKKKLDYTRLDKNGIIKTFYKFY